MAQTPDTIHLNVVPGGEDPGTLTEAEAIGVLVVGALHQRERERDQARRFAQSATEELAEAERLLGALAERLADSGWAHDADLAEQAQAFLTRERVPGAGE